MDVELSPDERRVVALAARGLTSDEIAAELGVAAVQVRGEMLRAMRALSAGSKLEAIVAAARRGLIDLDAAAAGGG